MKKENVSSTNLLPYFSFRTNPVINGNQGFNSVDPPNLCAHVNLAELFDKGSLKRWISLLALHIQRSSAKNHVWNKVSPPFPSLAEYPVHFYKTLEIREEMWVGSMVDGGLVVYVSYIQIHDAYKLPIIEVFSLHNCTTSTSLTRRRVDEEFCTSDKTLCLNPQEEYLISWKMSHWTQTPKESGFSGTDLQKRVTFSWKPHALTGFH